MTDAPKTAELIAQLVAIRKQLHTGRFGQREAWEQSLAEVEATLGAQMSVAPKIAELIARARAAAEGWRNPKGLVMPAGVQTFTLTYGNPTAELYDALADALAALAQEVERLTDEVASKEIELNLASTAVITHRNRAEAAEARVRELEVALGIIFKERDTIEAATIERCLNVIRTYTEIMRTEDSFNSQAPYNGTYAEAWADQETTANEIAAAIRVLIKEPAP